MLVVISGADHLTSSRPATSAVPCLLSGQTRSYFTQTAEPIYQPGSSSDASLPSHTGHHLKPSPPKQLTSSVKLSLKTSGADCNRLDPPSTGDRLCSFQPLEHHVQSDEFSPRSTQGNKPFCYGSLYIIAGDRHVSEVVCSVANECSVCRRTCSGYSPCGEYLAPGCWGDGTGGGHLYTSSCDKLVAAVCVGHSARISNTESPPVSGDQSAHYLQQMTGAHTLAADERMTDARSLAADQKMVTDARTSTADTPLSIGDRIITVNHQTNCDARLITSDALMSSEASTDIVDQQMKADACTMTVDAQVKYDSGTLLADQRMKSDAGTLPADQRMKSDAGTLLADQRMKSDAGTLLADQRMKSDAGTLLTDQRMKSDVYTMAVDAQVNSDAGTLEADYQLTTGRSTVKANSLMMARSAGLLTAAEVGTTTPAVHQAEYGVAMESHLEMTTLDAQPRFSVLQPFYSPPPPLLNCPPPGAFHQGQAIIHQPPPMTVMQAPPTHITIVQQGPPAQPPPAPPPPSVPVSSIPLSFEADPPTTVGPSSTDINTVPKANLCCCAGAEVRACCAK